MKVVSPLANFAINLASMKRRGGNLIISNQENDAMPVEITMSPRDGAHMFWLFFKSPSSWVYALSLPFFWLHKKGATSKSDDKYSGYDMNYPW